MRGRGSLRRQACGDGRLEVMLSYGLSDAQREWVRRHRKHCLSAAQPVVVEGRLNVREILNAAKATQKGWG